METVVDLANSPSFADKAVLDFFETSGRNLLAAEAAAGVKHHVALSVVGADRLPESGYLRAKVAQEKLIKESGVPFTIVRSTQFFEFLGGIAQSATDGETVRLSMRSARLNSRLNHKRNLNLPGLVSFNRLLKRMEHSRFVTTGVLRGHASGAGSEFLLGLEHLIKKL